MNEDEQPIDVLVSRHQPERASFKNYVIGFVSSLVLTLCAYLLTSHGAFRNSVLIGVLAGLALTQFIVQLVYFLHLGRELSPRFKTLVFGFMVSVVLIIVIGSLWIMGNLNHRMTPKAMLQYMISQDNL